MKLLFAGLALTALGLALLVFTDLQPSTPLIGGIVGIFLGVIHVMTGPDRGVAVSAGSDLDAQHLSGVAHGDF